MFDRRSGRRARDVRGQSTVSQERLSRRRDARGSVVRARRSARARFFSWNVFSWNETRSRVFVLAFWRTRVSERHRLALDAGTHPSVLPFRLTRLTRHARLQHHRRALHEPLRANLRRAVAHGARSVRVSLSAALKKFPGNHVGEIVERSARRERIPRPARAPRPDARTCAHRRTRSPSRSEWARGKRSFVARLGVPRASLVVDASNTRLDAALCSRSARAKMERVDSLLLLLFLHRLLVSKKQPNINS